MSSSQVLFNRETGKSRGFGFVIFKDEESVQEVMAVANHVIDNKEVEIKVAVPRAPNSISAAATSEPSTKATKHTGPRASMDSDTTDER